MREDHMEAIDKMFPQGYVIAYTCPNGDIRLSLYNPFQYESVDRLHRILVEEK